MELIFECCSS